MLKILLLPSEEFIPFNEPLAGIFQYDQACILRDAGYRVSVISVRLCFSLPMILKAIFFRLTGRKLNNQTKEFSVGSLLTLLYRKIFKPYEFVTRERTEGIEVYRSEGFYVLPPSPKRDYRYWVKAGMVAFDNYLKDHGKPDVIHAHNSFYGGLLGLEIKNKYGYPFLLTEHSSYFSRGLYHSKLFPKALAVFKNAKVSLAVSFFLANELKRFFPDTNFRVLANVVDPIFGEVELPDRKEENPFRFIHIGNLITIKRQTLLIEAFCEAFRKEENIILELAGEGEDEEKLRRLIAEKNMKNRIVLLGRLNKKEVLRKLDESHVLCLPSSIETFGVVLLEAIFRGVPVIATDCGGPADVVTPENGILVEKDNCTALKKALQAIKQNYHNYNPVIIRAQAMEKFGPETFLNRYESIIGSMKRP